MTETQSTGLTLKGDLRMIDSYQVSVKNLPFWFFRKQVYIMYKSPKNNRTMFRKSVQLPSF